MRLTVTVSESAAARPADVVVDAEPGTTAAQVGSALTRAVRPGGQGQAPLLYVAGQPVPGEVSLAESPLREGTLVGLGDPDACPPPEPAGVVEVRVVSGPDAGGVFRLQPGSATIGGRPEADVAFDDGSVPADAVGITVGADATATVTPQAGISVWLDGTPLTGPTTWRRGGQLAVGWTVVELAAPQPPDAAVQPSEDGAALDYNRPPRLRPAPRRSHFKMPSAPSQNEKRPLPIIMAVAPIVLAVVMVVIFQRYFFLAFALLSPVMVIGNYLTDKKHGRKSYNRKVGEYRQRKTALEGEARQALQAEEAERRHQSPDPATALLAAAGPRSRLWERRRDDPDYLLLRVGTGDLPSEVVLDDPSREEHRRSVTWTAADVPVTVPLHDRGVLGIAGPGETPRALARWVLAQAAVLHSPNDLQTYLLTDSAGRGSWGWVRWLPHARPADEPHAGVLAGADAETVTARISELSAIVTERRKALQESSATTFTDPDILVLLDGARRLRLQPGVIQILKEGPSVGVYAVCLDEDERTLPAECAAVVRVDPAGGLWVRQTGQAPVDNVRPECVTPGWCERLARGLAPLRDVSDDDEDSVLPGSCALLDVMDLEPPEPEAIVGRWNAGGRTTSAVLGIGLDGPYAIDLARDGPHGLVAGTTGSGKSELLQTIVGSLAAANRPDAMQFVLVDYKGGSAFKDCVHLPHTAGMVTDLDASLVERALESISAELRRREHLLAHAGASDIDGYTTVAGANPQLAPMPRLLIVIDEFASLVGELPDFVTGLVDLARRGRSLGIHLILATQRPSGVVSSEIRANTDLRIALRMTDAGESADVIDAPDAGRIPKSAPGRGYVRLGASPLIPFQTGRVGGRRVGTSPAAAASEPWAARLDPARLGYPSPEPPKAAVTEQEMTDLAVLVEAIDKATQTLAIPAQPSPWLPALPQALQLDELPAVAPQPGRLAPIPYGLEDLPAEQDQRAAALDLATLGHLFAIGGPRTGRSQLLRTLAGGVGRLHSPADVHLYGIDCGNGALLALSELPHCGAVVRNNQIERSVRLINRLGAEMQRRVEVLSEQGFADIGEQRAAAGDGDRLAHLLVLLDRWESFVTSLGELDNGQFADQIQRILREGASVGIHLIIAGDRSLLSGRMATLTDHKLVFRLPDKTDYSMVSINPKKVSDAMPAGRVLRSESGIETQIALLGGDTSGQGQAGALSRIAEQAREREPELPAAQRPFRVDVLPARLDFERAWEMRDGGSDGTASAATMWALCGVGGDTLTAYGPELGRGTPGFVIAGPPTSGRSTALLAMARSLQRAGVGLVAIAPRPSPLRSLDDDGVSLLTGADPDPDELSAAVDAAGDHAVVLIDDAELLKSCAASQQLVRLLQGGSGSGRALVIAGDSESVCQGLSGWQTDMKKARRGLLLSPQAATAGDIVGARLAKNAVGGSIQVGRGLLHLGGGDLITVQVPNTG